MANFFYATATFKDGHKETFKGRLWFLGGIRDEEGQALLAELRKKEAVGEIVRLRVSYES